MKFLKKLFGSETVKQVGRYFLKLVAREGRKAFEKKYGEFTLQVLVELIDGRGKGLDAVWNEAFAAIKSQVLRDGVDHADTWIARLLVEYYETIKAQDAAKVGAKVESVN